MKIKKICVAAVIAALYAALTYVSAALGLGYDQVQLRVSEALCILAAVCPEAIAGLTVGCLLGNLTSTLGPIDIICGTSATLLAAVFAYFFRNVKVKGLPVLSSFMPVLFNAVIVGLELTALFADGAAFLPTFAINALWVAVGEVVCAVALGLLLYKAVRSNRTLTSLLA